ncbi:hypothetical protein [Trabulsiella odontotermitis]|uniref:hypothetical protein n=1 Tax=Trabulsiella odontotermitis TaxID=379893 RepID=UPI000675FE53|nr:hypothetical protein [Trabulsiella odontotermitis]KNC89838.1 hypothetical protein GM30_05580 [Trabulsiella odontotermitis]
MKKEYAQKINALLECFHFNNEFMGQPFVHSLALLHHGISHLYFFVMCLGESDEETLAEMRGLIARVCDGEVPKPYDLSDVKSENAEASVTLCIKEPLVVSVELTPEMIDSLRKTLSDRHVFREDVIKSAQVMG